MRVLVTGATGFVGTALLPRLARESWAVRACAGSRGPGDHGRAEWVSAPRLSAEADWADLLAGVDVVVHLAAKVHVMGRAGAEAAQQYQRVNVQGTVRLAQQAMAAGARRFVYLSSVKVHGDSGALSEASPLVPVGPYGESKRDAEQALRALVTGAGMDVVIIRPPLVYGPGVRANFSLLMGAVRRGLPLPLGGVANRRSLVAVDNLADFIAVAATHPAAAGEAFLVSDGDDLSTPDLVRRLATAMNRPARLVAVPPGLLRLGATLLGQSAACDRLTGSLSVDISKARGLLGWTPPVPVDAALQRVVQA